MLSGSMDTTLMNTIRMVLINRFIIEHLSNYKPCEYYLNCKGDDSLAVFNFGKAPNDYLKPILNNYSRVFANPEQAKAAISQPTYIDKDLDGLTIKALNPRRCYGLGLVRKYLLVGDLSNINFCSTITIPCYDKTGSHITHFKILRNPSKVLKCDSYARLNPNVVNDPVFMGNYARIS